MSKYLDTLLKIKNGKCGSEWLPELEKIEQFVKGNITSKELMQNADDRLKYVVYHTLNKIINYEEKDIRYYIELPKGIFFNITIPYCIRAGKVDEVGIDFNIMKTIGPKYMSKYFPDFFDNNYIEIVGDYSQFSNGVMLFRSDWFRIISKYPNLVEKMHYLAINNNELEEKFRKINLEEVQQRVTSEVQYYVSAPKDGEPKIIWSGKEEAQYLPQEVIDSISFVIPKEYVTKQQVSNGQFGTFEEILSGSELLENLQAKSIYSKSYKNDEIIVGGIDMEKANKKIIYEYLLVNGAFQNELLQISDAEYSRHHQQNADWYRDFGDRFNSILGFTGQTQEEFMNFMVSFQLTPEQKRALVELRREPMFKKLIGETALQQKTELENLLGSKISSNGMTFADKNGATVATKTEQQLDQELNTHSDRLSELLSFGTITEEQYDRYDQNLDYIYDYYMSRSRGAQVPFRKMTNTQYEQVEQRAMENGISFNEQMFQETTDLMYSHEEIQKLQNGGVRR